MNRILRDEEREAKAPVRGFVAQFIETTLSILRLEDDERLYVEAFEDIQAVDGEGLTKNTQIKDRTDEFSITRKLECEMLERWAKVYNQRPRSVSFEFVTTQSPGNLYDKSSSFADWIGGQHDSATFESIRKSLYTFVSSKYSRCCPEIHRLFKDRVKSRQFWDSISWRLNEPSVAQRLEHLVELVAKRYAPSEITAESSAFALVGAVAYHAASENIDDRCWTKERLLRVVATDERYAYAIADLKSSFEVVSADVVAIREHTQQIPDIKRAVDELARQNTDTGLHALKHDAGSTEIRNRIMFVLKQIHRKIPQPDKIDNENPWPAVREMAATAHLLRKLASIVPIGLGYLQKAKNRLRCVGIRGHIRFGNTMLISNWCQSPQLSLPNLMSTC